MLKKAYSALIKIMPAFALIIGIASMNSACNSFYHQPKAPAAMEKYKKF